MSSEFISKGDFIYLIHGNIHFLKMRLKIVTPVYKTDHVMSTLYYCTEHVISKYKLHIKILLQLVIILINYINYQRIISSNQYYLSGFGNIDLIHK